MKFNVILVVLLANVFGFCLLAQQTTHNEKSLSRLISMDTLSQKIEKIHHVKLYYNPQWFSDKQFHESIVNQSTDECIRIIKRIADVDCIQLNEGLYIFVPLKLKNYSNKKDSEGFLFVGEKSKTNTTANVQLRGKITNVKDGAPLNGANIFIDKLNLSCVTDKNGHYQLNIPTGEYDVRLYYPGLKEEMINLRVNDNGIVNFEMAENLILLKEVEVRGSSIDMNVTGTQMSAVKLTAKAIKELPLFLGERDLIKGVTLLPGVQSTGEFGTGFFVRGGGSDQNLMLLEDVPLFNSSHVFGVSSAVNADCVNSVSLIKAGIPAKYGERASSVMDIRFNNNFDKFSLKGGIGLLDSRINLELPLLDKKLSWQISARSSYSDWLLHAMPDLELKQSSAKFYDVNSLLSYRLTAKDNLSVLGYLSNDQFSFTQQNQYKYDNTLVSMRYKHFFNEKLNLNLMAGFSRYRNNQNQRDSVQTSTAYKFSSSIQYYNTKLNVTWTPNDKHSIETGVNSILYNIQPGSLTPYDSLSTIATKKIASEKGVEMAAYLSDNWIISPKISFNYGLRYTLFAYLGPCNVLVFEQNATTTVGNILNTRYYGNNAVAKWYSGFEPRLSARFTVDKNSSIKASYNRMDQFINLISNTSVMSPSDVYKLSSPNFKPLVCTQIALGYFRNFQNNEFETSLEVYYKKLDNIMDYRNGASIFMNDRLEADLLKASGYNYGAELFLKKNSGKLTGWISYTFSSSMRHTTSPYPADQINSNCYYPSSFDKPHNLVVMANYHLTRRWWISGTFTYRTGQPVTLPEYKYTFQGNQYVYYSDRNKYRLQDYNRFDIAITHEENLKVKRSWKGSWTFALINAYGQKNPYSVYYTKSSGVSQSFNLYELFIIARPVPTITYNFSF